MTHCGPCHHRRESGDYPRLCLTRGVFGISLKRFAGIRAIEARRRAGG